MAAQEEAANARRRREMSVGEHTLGPTCAFHEDEPDRPLPEGSETPLVRARFFYVSSLPIDDPLSPIPPITADKTTKHPPQPFSLRDNAALEEAWQGFRTGHDGKHGGRSSSRPKSRQMFSFPKFKGGAKSPSPALPTLEQPHTSAALNESMDAQVQHEYNKLPAKPDTAAPNEDNGKAGKDPTPSELALHTTDLANTFGKDKKPRDVSSTPMIVKESQVMLSQTPQEPGQGAKPITEQELARADPDQPVPKPLQSKRKRHLSPFHRHSKPSTPGEGSSSRASTPVTTERAEQSPQLPASDMSGRPFARAPSKRDVGSANQDPTGRMLDGADGQSIFSDVSQDEPAGSRGRAKTPRKSGKHQNDKEHPKVFVPVGVSRLHLVEMPDLMMKPIYWSPINDTSKVIRATWFYKDTMLPVPIDVANQLEVGYEDIKPYLDSYQDELQACVENGASAELKVVHKLWPHGPDKSRPGTGTDSKLGQDIDHDTFNPTFTIRQENVAVDPDPPRERRLFETHSVIFIDRKNAQILRPSLLPSTRHNRRPLSSIRKGRQIGIAVVRGFNLTEWQRLHPDAKMNEKAAHAKIGAYMSQSGDATTRDRRKSCTTCEDSPTPNVSDLILVVHGIGQKLSERVDSFHFTHAINDVRRQFNVELSSEAVKGNLKQNTGMMVLPVNWRLTVSFDNDAKGKTEGDQEHKFELKNITPGTLPAVRSIISDVMLDIPYYMSHHKEKMTSAVIREANRVYRLWCRNNPDFRENGRVHLIAHSLGSVMAMEILSQQPTRVPRNLGLDHGKPSEKMFEFDTTNLFMCGSPGGFFLLLHNAHLIPRKGRNKPGMEGEDHGSVVASEEGYGCLAVDNIYNVLDRNDPISYLANASVDTDYAESLQPANIPLPQLASGARWVVPLASDLARLRVATLQKRHLSALRCSPCQARSRWIPTISLEKK